MKGAIFYSYGEGWMFCCKVSTPLLTFSKGIYTYYEFLVRYQYITSLSTSQTVSHFGSLLMNYNPYKLQYSFVDMSKLFLTWVLYAPLLCSTRFRNERKYFCLLQIPYHNTNNEYRVFDDISL